MKFWSYRFTIVFNGGAERQRFLKISRLLTRYCDLTGGGPGYVLKSYSFPNLFPRIVYDII